MKKYLLKRKTQDYVPGGETFTLPVPNFDDDCTDFVYISDKLKDFYPETYNRLTSLFTQMKIEWGEVKGTKDIWIRDYMPIQIDDDRYLFYKYNPDYLKESGEKYLTDAHAVKKGVLHHYYWRNINIILDGGNVVPAGEYRVLTEKVFKENGKVPYDPDFVGCLLTFYTPTSSFSPGAATIRRGPMPMSTDMLTASCDGRAAIGFSCRTFAISSRKKQMRQNADWKRLVSR